MTENAIWVVVVPATRQPESVTAEMLGEARRIAGSDLRVHAVVIGHGVETSELPLASLGADEGLLLDDPGLAGYDPERYAAVLADAVRDEAPRVVLFPGTVLGRDLGARAAAALDMGFAANCVDAEYSDDGLVVTRAVEGGRNHQIERFGQAPFLLAIVPDTIGSDAPDPARQMVWRHLDVAGAEGGSRLRDAGFVAADPRTMDLVDADVIVAGGRGMGGPEGFELLEQLADMLGGSVGASRPAVEAGWAPYERQVGQTGRTVRPRLYLACGISGASQHLAGMSDAKTVVAINTDPSAPMLAKARLAVEAEVEPVLTALLAGIERRGPRR